MLDDTDPLVGVVLESSLEWFCLTGVSTIDIPVSLVADIYVSKAMY